MPEPIAIPIMDDVGRLFAVGMYVDEADVCVDETVELTG